MLRPVKQGCAERSSYRLLAMAVLCVLVTALMTTQSALADDYSAGWGPAVGTKMPVLEAPDQSGNLRTMDNLAGEQGLLLFLSRSADW